MGKWKHRKAKWLTKVIQTSSRHSTWSQVIWLLRNLTWFPLNHASHPEHLAWDKGKQKLFCGHVWRHQIKGTITSIQMRIWWGARRAGWRRKSLKQFYFSEPSLEIYKFMMSREKGGKCYKWLSIPGLSQRAVRNCSWSREQDQDQSLGDVQWVWSKAQLWFIRWGLVSKLRFMVTHPNNACQALVLMPSLKMTPERQHSGDLSLHHFDTTGVTILQKERNCIQVNCIKIMLMAQITVFQGIHL